MKFLSWNVAFGSPFHRTSGKAAVRAYLDTVDAQVLLLQWSPRQQVLAVIDKRPRLLGLHLTVRHKPEKPLQPITVIVPEGWTYDGERRERDVTSEALRRHRQVFGG